MVIFLYLEPSLKIYCADDFLTHENEDISFLGQGGYGEVWLCRYQQVNYVAVKCLPLYGSGRSIKNAPER